MNIYPGVLPAEFGSATNGVELFFATNNSHSAEYTSWGNQVLIGYNDVINDITDYTIVSNSYIVINSHDEAAFYFRIDPFGNSEAGAWVENYNNYDGMVLWHTCSKPYPYAKRG